MGEYQNTTKVPNDNLLDNGGVQGDNEGSNDDTKVPKDLGGSNDNDNDDGPTIILKINSNDIKLLFISTVASGILLSIAAILV